MTSVLLEHLFTHRNVFKHQSQCGDFARWCSFCKTPTRSGSSGVSLILSNTQLTASLVFSPPPVSLDAASKQL